MVSNQFYFLYGDYVEWIRITDFKNEYKNIKYDWNIKTIKHFNPTHIKDIKGPESYRRTNILKSTRNLLISNLFCKTLNDKSKQFNN